ncbi:MAG: ATP-binding protein [Nitrospinota bacterium]
MKGFELKIPSDPSFLRMVRKAVETICAMGGLDEEERCKVVLAVDEACTNIIRHSYDGATDQPIICTGEIDDGVINIALRDFGKKVDPSRIKPRELDDVRPGGLGVHIIREVMDTVDFRDCGEKGTLLRLQKRLPVGEGKD